MSEFDKWYYTSDKCDNRFDNWIENRHPYYYSRDAWDHQQQKINLMQKAINKLKKDKELLTNCLTRIESELSCDHENACECTPCGIDAMLSRYGAQGNIDLQQKINQLENELNHIEDN